MTALAGLTLNSDTDWATRLTPSSSRCAALLLSFKKPPAWKKPQTQLFNYSYNFNNIRINVYMKISFRRDKLRFPYSWPNVVDLSADNCVHGVLVSIPVLTAPIDDATVRAFYNVPNHKEKKHMLQLLFNSYASNFLTLTDKLSNLLTRTRQIWQDQSMGSLRKQRSLGQQSLPFLLHNRTNALHNTLLLTYHQSNKWNSAVIERPLSLSHLAYLTGVNAIVIQRGVTAALLGIVAATFCQVVHAILAFRPVMNEAMGDVH